MGAEDRYAATSVVRKVGGDPLFDTMTGVPQHKDSINVVENPSSYIYGERK